MARMGSGQDPEQQLRDALTRLQGELGPAGAAAGAGAGAAAGDD
jgi:hypothetical protein